MVIITPPNLSQQTQDAPAPETAAKRWRTNLGAFSGLHLTGDHPLVSLPRSCERRGGEPSFGMRRDET